MNAEHFANEQLPVLKKPQPNDHTIVLQNFVANHQIISVAPLQPEVWTSLHKQLVKLWAFMNFKNNLILASTHRIFCSRR